MIDIRYPMGGMFTILGVILAAFGLFSDPAIYRVHSLGVNVNLIWGCVLLVFGVCLLVLARRAGKKRAGRHVEDR